MLGFRSALCALDAGRSAFFGSPSFDLPKNRTSQIAVDDLVPQFGFVGADYERFRILLLGINPGNGSGSQRSTADEQLIPAFRRFEQTRTEEDFSLASKTYQEVCQCFHIWKSQCNDIMRELGPAIGHEQIAFSNCLPFRRDSEAKFPRTVENFAARYYVTPLLDEIKPRVLICVGKTSLNIYNKSGRNTLNTLYWNCDRIRQRAEPHNRIVADRLKRLIRQAEPANRS